MGGKSPFTEGKKKTENLSLTMFLPFFPHNTEKYSNKGVNMHDSLLTDI